MRTYQAILFLTLMTSGCIQSPPPLPPRTQLQIRAFQTRSYPNHDTKAVMKAVINTLMDDGFLVRNADKDLGFINANKEVNQGDRFDRFWAVMAQGENARYRVNSVTEASVNVSEFGAETKVRVVFQIKVIDNFGVPMDTRTIDDLAVYQEFFSKVDKSLFIDREKL
jgi:hypothetical protein